MAIQYVLDVLLPEAVIRMHMKLFNISYEQADEVLSMILFENTANELDRLNRGEAERVEAELKALDANASRADSNVADENGDDCDTEVIE